jgi:hypothetical protein
MISAMKKTDSRITKTDSILDNGGKRGDLPPENWLRF